MKFTDIVLTFICMGVITVFGNLFGYQVPIMDTVIGFTIMLIITLVGIAIAKIIPLKLPMVFWISIIALLSTSPISPPALSKAITEYTNKIDFLALCTPILAYAGLSIGKDLKMFQQMSWRIVVVALATYTGTFVCATAIAQVMLHFEGLI